MRHVERCAKQILLLGGEVEMTASNSVQKIHDLKAMLEMAYKMEQGSISDYNQWAIECAANSDSASRKVLRDWLMMKNYIIASTILKWRKSTNLENIPGGTIRGRQPEYAYPSHWRINIPNLKLLCRFGQDVLFWLLIDFK